MYSRVIRSLALMAAEVGWGLWVRGNVTSGNGTTPSGPAATAAGCDTGVEAGAPAQPSRAEPATSAVSRRACIKDLLERSESGAPIRGAPHRRPCRISGDGPGTRQ